MFLLSFTGVSSSRYRVEALAAPGVAAADAFQRHPAAARSPIALDCGDRIGGAARLIAAARRQDLRRALLPGLGDQDQQLCDHFARNRSRAPISSARSWPKSRSIPLFRPIST